MWERFKEQNILFQLIIINVAVFVLYNVIYFASNWAIPMEAHTDLSELIRRPWSIVTHMFMHKQFSHLFWNMITLYISGQIFLQYFGQKKYLSVYLLGGLVGFSFLILLALLSPKVSSGFIIGASAAVSCIVVASAVYAPNHLLRFFVIDVKWWIIASIIILGNFSAINESSNVGGHLAHIGGALFGFIFVYYYRRNNDLSKRFENTLDRFFNLFKKKKTPVFKVHKNDKRKHTSERRSKTDEEFNLEKKKSEAQLNAILDKISKSGYDSLSKSEKDFLFNQSKK